MFVDASKDLLYSMNSSNKKFFFLTKLALSNYLIGSNKNQYSLRYLINTIQDYIYMNSVYIMLVILSIFSGYVLNEIFFGFGYSTIHFTLDTNTYLFLLFDSESILFSNQLLTCAYAIIGWVSGFLLYFNIQKITINIHNTLETTLNVLNIKSFSFLAHRWYFDIIINRYIVANTFYFNYSILLKIIDYTVTEYMASIYLSNIIQQYNSILKQIQQIGLKSNFYLFFFCIFTYLLYFIIL
jgi:hypothetical protein